MLFRSYPWTAGEELTAKDLNAFSKFGGDGSDGALVISSGTTSIDLLNSATFIKNYSSISITGTGSLIFTNPHPDGTIIILKSSEDVTLTSTASYCIDASGMGAQGGKISASISGAINLDGGDGGVGGTYITAGKIGRAHV